MCDFCLHRRVSAKAAPATSQSLTVVIASPDKSGRGNVY
jgi:hypothetical protein